jgi:hypothetical protein
MYVYNPTTGQLDISSVTPFQARYYGSFYDDTQQPNPNPAQANIMSIGTTVTNFGMSIINGDTIKIVNTGIYSITFSVQLANGENKINRFAIWLVKNGNIVPNTNSEASVTGSHGGGDGHYLVTVNLMDQFVGGDEIQFGWWADDTDVSVETLPAVPASPTTPERPASPGFIVTVQEV